MALSEWPSILKDLASALHEVAAELRATRELQSPPVPEGVLPQVEFNAPTDEDIQKELLRRAEYEEHAGKLLRPWEDVPDDFLGSAGEVPEVREDMEGSG